MSEQLPACPGGAGRDQEDLRRAALLAPAQGKGFRVPGAAGWRRGDAQSGWEPHHIMEMVDPCWGGGCLVGHAHPRGCSR